MTRTTQTVRRLGSETARTLLVLVVTALALTAPVAAATPAVSATGGTVAPGGEVTVEISLDNAQTAKLSDIPSDWSVVSHDDDGGSFRNNIDSDGLVGWVWLSGDQSSASVSVTFNVPDDATSRDLSVTVEDSESNLEAYTTIRPLSRSNLPTVCVGNLFDDTQAEPCPVLCS